MNASNKPANNPASKPAYGVTIRREPRFATHGVCFVARDDEGHWRAWGPASKAPATSGPQLAQYLFHADEIATVEVNASGETIAIIAVE